MRRALVLIAASALSGLLACGKAGPDPRIAEVENGLRPPVLVEGDKTWSLAQRMRDLDVAGVSIAVIRDSKIDWAKGYGSADLEEKKPVTPDTLFQAGSISKPVAAMGALVLVEQGKLSLTADINTELKSWQVPANDHTGKAPVTLEGLLSHTAGLTVHGFPGYGAGKPVPTVVQILDGVAPANTLAVRVDLDPGTQWRYSGGGYTIAQLAMTDVTGEPFPQLLEKLVLRPLGMNRSTYDQPLPDALLPAAAAGYRRDGSPVPGKRHVYPEMAAAGLWTTASDLARFAIGVQRMLRGDKGPLSKAMAQDMVTPRKGDYGLGFGIEGQYFTHGGADEGFQAFLYASETKGYGVALMTNSDSGMDLMREIVRSVAATYRWEGHQDKPVKAAKLGPEALAPFAGRYELDRTTALAVSVQGAGLEARPTLGEAFELVPVSANAFVRRDRETRYVFAGAELKIEEAHGESRSIPRLSEEARLPGEDLEAGNLDAALAGYRRVRDANPSDRAVDERQLNGLGYTLLGQQALSEAIAVFRINTELYPDSTNVWDSLGEGLEAGGDDAGAIAAYRKAVEVASQSHPEGAAPSDIAAAHSLKRLEALGARP